MVSFCFKASSCVDVRVRRDEDAIAEYATKALAFLDEVAREVAAARGWKTLEATA